MATNPAEGNGGAASSTETTLDPIFHSLADGICVTGDDDGILYMNPAAEQMLDITLKEAKGLSLCDLLCAHLSTSQCSECKSSCKLLDAKTDTKAVTFNGRHGPTLSYEWKDFGLHRLENWKELRVRCMKMAAPWLDSLPGRKHFTILEDVAAETELQRHKEDWRNMIAHDLRTPLTTIYAALRTSQEAVAALQPPLPETKLLDLGVRACQKMTELLDLYLDVAKLDAGLMGVKLERVDAAAVVRNCVEEQIPLAQSRHVEVSMKVPHQLEAWADIQLLARIIQNVLNNAIKYTPANGGVVIKAGPAKTTGIFISIKDSGPGINPADLPHIFDRYYQSKARRAGKLQGTGLGLTFCREALKAMEGSIAAHSTLGSGSEFTIHLPSNAPVKTAPKEKK